MHEEDNLWYKDAVIYEVHVRAFYDNAGDGHGSFTGLTQKLDYLVDLGITAIWLLPFYPSPLKDDGYDIAAYTSIHPQYGTLDEFKAFLDAAHERGLRVITELVLNHTSDQHPWFQRARHAPAGSPERDFYVWSDTAEKYQEARVIFQDFEPSNWSWDPVAGAYYWHRFYSHQPDLNFDNPAVWEAIFPVVDFWLAMGVDGLRLDAVPYLYEREGTNCENLPETHLFLRALRQHVDERYPGRMFLAEANQWPEDAVAYFGQGDECHMAFHFPLMPRLFMALHQEDRFPIHDIMAQTPAIPETSQWCLFLRNHDELTLEMVTDEERDYMYRAYTRDRLSKINLGIRHRLAPLLRNDRRRIELMNALMFSLPGTPVLYYGDEIGMGDNIYLGDRNGVRTPMQWSSDRNAGFSRANPQKLYLPVIVDPEFYYATINVESQQSNPSSLLWWMKRLIALRKRYRAFGRGSFELLQSDNPKVLAFIRRYEQEQILVVANLSRFVQCAHLDLKEYSGVAPEEMYGRTRFPRIGEQPYLLSLSPHAFMWFDLPAPEAPPAAPVDSSPEMGAKPELPLLAGSLGLENRFRQSARQDIEALLPGYMLRNGLINPAQFRHACQIEQAFPLEVSGARVWFLLVRILVGSGEPEVVWLGLTFVGETNVDQLMVPLEQAGLARLEEPERGYLCNVLAVPERCLDIVRGVLSGRTRPVAGGELAAECVVPGGESIVDAAAFVPLSVDRSERNNTSVRFGSSYILKVFRRAAEGVNPDLETGRFLAGNPDYTGSAGVVGYIEYRRHGSEPITLGVLHRFVPNQGTAWRVTLDHLSQYFEKVAALSLEQPPSPPLRRGLVPSESGDAPPGDFWEEMVGAYRSMASLMGQRTAEMHRALAANRAVLEFTPEPLGKLYQRSMYQSMRNRTGRLCDRLAAALDGLSENARPLAEEVVRQRNSILNRFRALLDPSLSSFRIRCHGDYHLGQLLSTGKDFVVIDFEGDTTRTIGERRLKRPPLRDVADMIRSFDYAAQSVLLGMTHGRDVPPGRIRPEDQATLEPWAWAWYEQIVGDFLSAYLAAAADDGLLPKTDRARIDLVELLILEKALAEVDAELEHRPEWAIIPLRSVVRLLATDPEDPAFLP
jgi:maltose alpha-D-glucosyltransferase / alpha-amylase